MDNVGQWMTEARKKGAVGCGDAGQQRQEAQEVELLPSTANAYQRGNLQIYIFPKRQLT